MNDVTWQGPPIPPTPKLDVWAWLRIAWRGGLILGALAVCLPIALILRVPEIIFFRPYRPITPWITKILCRLWCWILGLGRDMQGRASNQPGAFVANHVSWLDIIVLNACSCLYFVAKADIRHWPGIGLLAAITGTVFISRNRQKAGHDARFIQTRLQSGHKLLFFPEGTSTDGKRILPFRSALFSAFYAKGQADRDYTIQPITLAYHAPKGAEARFYGWWGDMEFGPNLLQILSAPRHGRVQVMFHTPLPCKDLPDR
jgi:1-acyl-sn-glycerol-3-phosphate acyltransferase